MDLKEAERVLEAAFPHQGVTVKVMAKGSYQVTKANGEVIGAAFDLQKALQQACRPILDAEHRRLQDESKVKTLLFVQFQKFLQERFADEFQAWVDWQEARNAKTEVAAGGEKRAESDQKQLVLFASSELDAGKTGAP